MVCADNLQSLFIRLYGRRSDFHWKCQNALSKFIYSKTKIKENVHDLYNFTANPLWEVGVRWRGGRDQVKHFLTNVLAAVNVVQHGKYRSRMPHIFTYNFNVFIILFCYYFGFTVHAHRPPLSIAWC
jgi:hypothetical protein